MITNSNLKKNPIAVRKRILDAAENIANRDGLSSLTIQAVANEANISKGGIFHHFSDKNCIIDAVFDRIIDKFSSSLDNFLAQDLHHRGKFTRAYINAIFEEILISFKTECNHIAIALIIDPRLKHRWSKWITNKLIIFSEDSNSDLNIARLAADGLWFAFFLETSKYSLSEISSLHNALINMTY